MQAASKDGLTFSGSLCYLCIFKIMNVNQYAIPTVLFLLQTKVYSWNDMKAIRDTDKICIALSM